MRRISWALPVWLTIGIVGIWVADAASHAASPGPGQGTGLVLPAWVLFEVWAIGFVLLGALRRISRVILAWTILWIVLFGIWALDPDPSIIGNGPGSGALLQLKPPDWALFDGWAIGFVVLCAAWLVARVRTSRRRVPGHV
jgi:hypothetical protein